MGSLNKLSNSAHFLLLYSLFSTALLYVACIVSTLLLNNQFNWCIAFISFGVVRVLFPAVSSVFLSASFGFVRVLFACPVLESVSPQFITVQYFFDDLYDIASAVAFFLVHSFFRFCFVADYFIVFSSWFLDFLFVFHLFITNHSPAPSSECSDAWQVVQLV